jgi:hypothetical protein
MAKHSDGEWLAREGDTLNPERPWGIVVLLSREECIAIDGDDSTYGQRTSVIAEVCEADGEIHKADAILMAASKDLLLALQDCLPDLEHYVSTHGPGPDKRLAKAKDAIAKALA